MIEVRHYLDPAGRNAFEEWLEQLTDMEAQAKIMIRIERMHGGNFGDNKALGNGLHELRIDRGPGYRVYFAKVGKTVILLLCGGDKRKQSSDIERGRWRI